MKTIISILISLLFFTSCHDEKYGDKLSYKETNRIIKESFNKMHLIRNKNDGKVYFIDSLPYDKKIFFNSQSNYKKIHLSKFRVFRNKDFVLKNQIDILKNNDITDYYYINFHKSKSNELSCHIIFNYRGTPSGVILIEPGFVIYTFVYNFIDGKWQFVREEDWN